ncbi:hypothetical protein [Sphingobacterium sp.]|uniref:hypothetical protein n=1 Tax=Sphingobacterium sp. TaxID=341027 RepID=UPI00289EBB35|nr:hypothetical protein [Sphingobacterium sp.]
MKGLKLIALSLLIAMLFNLIGTNEIGLKPFWPPMSWTYVFQFTLSILLPVLLTQALLKVFWTHWQKQYPDLKLLDNGKIKTESLPYTKRIRAILYTAAGTISIHLGCMYVLFDRIDGQDKLFSMYCLYYLPWVSTGLVANVIVVFRQGRLWWLTSENVLVLFEKEIMAKQHTVENRPESAGRAQLPTVSDAYIVPGFLFDVLYNSSPFNIENLQKDAVRMFDVPFYFSQKRKKEIILIDGSRVDGSHFVQELERLRLDKWYFRISKTCRVNMMLVRYPVDPYATHLEFRKEVFDYLHTKMSELEIMSLLLVTEWMRKEKKLKDFIDNLHTLRHEHWDRLIPLN